MLAGKKILLGVSGSIAAYKSALLVRLLVKEGATVRVIMTPSAHDFITPLTLSTLSRNPVLTDFIKDTNGEWNNHVDLGLWADAMIIAPASANTISKMAAGMCDNLLIATYLSARCPVFFAPAMDLDMLKHHATKNNIKKLTSYGNQQIMPNHGELASGLVGTGRMAEPEEIVSLINNHLAISAPLAGKTALVTAGPTHEALDPVRFIGNNSSGKMGYAIAEALANKGATVTLVSGPTPLTTHHPKIKIRKVISAEEMYTACVSEYSTSDIAVFAAAVADYQPVIRANQKIKKSDSTFTLELKKTRDIAAELGKLKRKGQFTIGFALETEHERSNAEKKIAAKNFDLIVLNSLNDAGAGFGHDTNKITLIDKHNNATEFNLKPKEEVAIDIVNAIISNWHA